ncbi:hypothetical protein GCM10027093_56360 [Paraburkholderia jirisanensis]
MLLETARQIEQATGGAVGSHRAPHIARRTDYFDMPAAFMKARIEVSTGIS